MEPASFVSDISVFSGPIVSGIAAIILVWLVYIKKLTWVRSSLYFFLTVLMGLISSFAYLSFHSYLFSGDSAMIAVVQPILCLIFNIPVALIFFISLIIVDRKNKGRDLFILMKVFIAIYIIFYFVALILPLESGFDDNRLKFYTVVVTLPWSILLIEISNSVARPSPLDFWLMIAFSGGVNIFFSIFWLRKKEKGKSKQCAS